MVHEPVRGVLPEPGIFSLPGLERMRLYERGRLPATPHARLLGYRITQVSSGSTVVSQPITGWSELYDGLADITPTVALSAYTTASTAAPPGVDLRLVTLSIRYLRSLTLDDGSVVARGRLLHAGSTFSTVEALVEDALGRSVAHATATMVNVVLDPPLPTWSLPHDEPAQEAVYATPDPYRRPVRPSPERSDLGPAAAYLGVRIQERSDTSVVTAMPASPWFSNVRREVDPGIVAAFTNFTAGFVSRQGIDDRRVVTFEVTFSILRPAPPADGRELTGTASVAERVDDIIVIDGRTQDADGTPLSVGHGTVQLRARRKRRRSPSNRVLLTVLFTDLVGSTQRAGEDGDEKWRTVLEDHHAIVRRQIELHLGREIKTTGDGFLATFESPTRAVQCARGIQSGLDRIGLEIRAGVHTGECELVGNDVAGLAVHVASRVQSAADPGEILVSSTVKELATGSGVGFVDRGRHQLRGIQDDWQLFAVSPD